ncbi:MAG TPA: hypothetical protein VF119_09150 [Candidatus Limnocylindrales bacterium]
MNPLLAGVAMAVVAGGIVAVSVRDARVVVLALTAVLVLTPAVADPMAAPAGLAARGIGGILAGYLLLIATRSRTDVSVPVATTEGSRIGWPAEILVAAAASVAGMAAHGLGAPAIGPAAATAAGFAIAAIAVPSVLTGRDLVRIGAGLLLMLDAALLVRVALGGTPQPLEQLLTAALLIALAGAIAAVARAARSDGHGGFDLAIETTHRRHEPDAHPMSDPPVANG